MNEMIERMVASLVDSFHGLCKYELADDIYLTAARAAIEAIRDNLPRDVELAANAIPIEREIDGHEREVTFRVTRYEAADIWAAMIDAALERKKPAPAPVKDAEAE